MLIVWVSLAWHATTPCAVAPPNKALDHAGDTKQTHAWPAFAFLQSQAEIIQAATLTWRQWHLNYYHGLGESVFEVHSLACKWLHYCGAANSTQLAPIFIERPGDQASWAQFLPAAETALKCLFPGPNYFIGDERIKNKASMLHIASA